MAFLIEKDSMRNQHGVLAHRNKYTYYENTFKMHLKKSKNLNKKFLVGI
jgi:hypothetical protein